MESVVARAVAVHSPVLWWRLEPGALTASKLDMVAGPAQVGAVPREAKVAECWRRVT